MRVKKVPYQALKVYLFLDQKRKLEIVKRIQKQITKFDHESETFNFATN